MSHGQSPDRLLNHHHMTVLIVLTYLLFTFPIVPDLLFLVSLFPKVIVRLLRTLSQVAASVVYKLACIVERGLKPDLVFYPSVVAPPTFSVCLPSLSLSHFPLGRLWILQRLYLHRPYSKTSVLGVFSRLLPTSLRVPVPCDHLRRKTTRARRTLRPLDLNIVTCDHVDDQSLGRSYDTFPGSRVCISRDLKVVKMSHDWTRDWSGDSFPGSCGWRVDSTTWLYFSLGVALGGLGLGILWMHDVADSVLDTQEGQALFWGHRCQGTS